MTLETKFTWVTARDDGATAAPLTRVKPPPDAVNRVAAREVKITIVITVLVACLCWAAGFYVIAVGRSNLVLPFDLSDTLTEVLLLIVALIVTFLADGLGYAHATSLRWALYREGRLEFNTNFRLFTSARHSFANRWPMNFISAASIILCYSSSSALVLRGTFENDADFVVNGMAFVFMGVGLLGQVVSALLCMRHIPERIPSWSPNPLWNTLTSLRGHSPVEHRTDRCMKSVFQKDEPSGPTQPRPSQPTLWTLRSTKWIVGSIWFLCVLSFIWAGIIIHIPSAMFYDGDFSFSWNAESQDTYHFVIFGMDPYTNSPSNHVIFPAGLQFFLGILFLCFVQGLQTIGLHCVELLVNMTRDERVWRRAASPSGVSPSSSPLVAALGSWRTVFLTALKTVQHWILGQSMVLHYHLPMYNGDGPQFTFNMSSSRLLIFAAVTAATAIYTTILAFWPVRGSQPVTWGHLQTLADLVDNWNAPDDRMWWGDKGSHGNGVKHAGTAGKADEVGPIDKDSLYAGKALQ